MAFGGMDRTPYPAVLRLYAIAEERWAEVEAHYIQIDLLGIGPRRFLNCVYAWCVQRLDPERREEWEMNLTAPLQQVGGTQPVERVTEKVAEVEGAAFMAAMALNEQMAGG